MARILVIDDDHEMMAATAAVLVRSGHDVMTADNGRAGLKCFRAQPADVIVTDIVMPEEDGIGVLLALREEFPDVPVITMSGHPIHSALYLGMAQKLGARRTLVKPFTPEEVSRAVDDVLREVAPLRARPREG